MNQTKKHTTGKKLLALLLALIMTVSLLPMSVFAAEPGTEETPVVEGQTQPAAETGADDADQAQEPDADEANEDEAPVDEGEDTALPGDAEGDADDADAADDGIATFAATDSNATLDYRIVHLDCGRKYFSVANIKTLIDNMYLAGYNQLELAIGNAGLRFLLDDMSISFTVNGNTITYDNDTMVEKIKAGNKAQNNSNDDSCLTETDMKLIIAYANARGIEVVPLLNMPGHMNAVLNGFPNYRISGSNGKETVKSSSTLNLNSDEAKAFGLALLQKYVDFFKGRVSYFNFGADEVANDIVNPFYGYNSGYETQCVPYMNKCAEIIDTADMRPRAFNDYMYFGKNNSGTSVALNTAIEVCFWNTQWQSACPYVYPGVIAQKGHKLINTNSEWYYVLGNKNNNLNYALDYVESLDYNAYHVSDHKTVTADTAGVMICLWCDQPNAGTQETVITEGTTLLKAFAEKEANSTLGFTKATITTEAPVIMGAQKTVALSTGTMSVSVQDAASTVKWASSDPDVITVEETATGATLKLLKAGTATITATSTNGSDSVTIKVTDSSGGGTEKPEPTEPSTKPVEVKLSVGQTSEGYEGAAGATITKLGDTSIATAKLEPSQQDGGTKRTLGAKITTDIASGKDVVISDGNGNYIKVDGSTIGTTDSIDDATVFTVKVVGDNEHEKVYTINVKDNGQYLSVVYSGSGYSDTRSLGLNESPSSGVYWRYDSYDDSYVFRHNSGNKLLYIVYSNDSWTVASKNNSSVYGKAYTFRDDPVSGKDVTNITFTGVKVGTTTYVIDDVTYVVTVKAKEVPVTLEVGDRVTFDVGNDRISESPDTDIAKAELDGKGTLTLTGVAVGGPTYCTVGDTRYVITVVEKSSAAGTLLYVDLWVTNHGVLPDGDGLEFANNSGTGTGNRRVTVQYEASKFASPDGELLSDVLPKTGTDTANKIAARYWKTRYLPEATRQKTAGWTNKSGYGTDVLSGEAGGKDIERIRYYAGKWSYLPVDGTEWIDFNTSASNMVTQKESGAQIAAYYLLKTEVTKEVTTYITDWPDPHDTGSTAIYGVALDYCVKYPGDNVTRYPDTFGNSNNNTHWFNCDGTIDGLADKNGYTVDANVANAAGWTGRRTNATTSQKNSYDDCYRVINNIEAIDTAEYEVYMITTTPSDSFDLKGYTQCPDMITYPTTREEVIWAIDDQAVTDSGLAKHAELVVGGTPRVNRVMIQQCSGLLLTYYVRAKSNVENLHVNYYDQDTGLLIHSYDIIPHETQTPNNFAGFQWDNANLNAGFATGTDYVYNNEGKKVTVQTDLTKVSGIAGKYQVGFALVEINKTDDNKTLNLYYKLDNSRTYVVDFGVPANVERWGENDFTKISVEETTLYENRATTKKEVSKTNGKLYVDSKGDLYYQLTTMQYKNPDTFNVTYTYQDTGTSTGTTDNSNTYTVTFIPASNVYYEDDNAFMTFTPGAGTAKDAVWNEEFDDSSNQTPAESKQIAEVLNAATNVYGTDPTYENSTKFSLGRAHKVTVSADMVTDWNDNTCRWPTAEFTFKGTGFDVISLTDNKSGLLTYKVEKLETDGTWTIERQRFVSNYYDYGFKNGEWTNVESTDENALYQLPVVKVDGLTYGTYRVTLIVAYGELFDKTGNKEYSFWLDGVRIYDPAGPDLNNTYANDGEGWPKYIELHDELVKNDKNATTLFIEGDAQADIKAYTSYGPNHEVYLLNEQILAFKLANTAKVDKIHIGAKAPMGHATLKVNGQVIEPAIRTATDMYYDITKLVKDDGTVIITNADTAGDSILSLTQLKVTYTAEPTETGLASLAILTETEKQQVVQMVRAMYAPVEPEVFTPERFEASWNRSTVKVGQRATLTVKTSTDVDVITVDGVTVTNYRTRTQRTGWGWNATKVTYREFTYTITATEAGTLDYSVVAVNADGVSSEPITAALTVQAVQRPQRPSWLDKIFSRWF